MNKYFLIISVASFNVHNMEYKFHDQNFNDISHELLSIQASLNDIETHIENTENLNDNCACSFVSKFINNKKTFYALNALNVNKTNMILEKNDWRSIFIMNPPTPEELPNVISQLEKYIGKVYRTEYMWTIREQNVILAIKFKKWYNDEFTRALRSELIVLQEINKSNYKKQYLELVLDFGKYNFDLLLCKRKSKQPVSDDTTIVPPVDSDTRMRRTIT